MIRVDAITPQFSRLYRTVDNIDHLLLRIRLIDDDASKQFEEIATFRWQEKRLSPFERQLYADEANCVTDVEREYNAILRRTPRRSANNDIIFTYTQRDDVDVGASQMALGGGDVSSSYDMIASIERCMRHAAIDGADDEDTTCMHVMADFGERVHSTWQRHEHPLLTVRYDAVRRHLLLAPDFTGFNALALRVTTGETTRTLRVHIENASLDGVTRGELVREAAALARVLRSAVSAPAQSFAAVQSVVVHVSIEFLSAHDFDADSVFLRYCIDVGDTWRPLDDALSLTGVTMTSLRNGCGRHHFGYPLEFSLTSAHGLSGVMHSAILYVEVIAKDTWCRFRSEGLAYLVLPTWQPGWRTHNVRCARLTSGRIGEMRRFFVGDAANFNELSAIGPAQMARGARSNRLATRTTSAGCLRIRTSIAHVMPASTGLRRNKWRHLHHDERHKSVQEIVDAFQAAREALIQIRNAV